VKKVLLVNWDSYPNVTSGGVYSWEKLLVESMTDYDFTVFNMLSNPNVNGSYSVPANVSKVIDVPLFGSHRLEEFHADGKGLVKKILETNQKVIEGVFIPLFAQFLREAISNDAEPPKIAQIILKLHQFLRDHDSRKCMESILAWETFSGLLEQDPLYREMTLREALTAFQIIQRNMQILALDIPQTDLIHSSLAWLPAMIAIAAKMETGVPVLVTEHGVAFRELLLYYNAYLRDEPSNIFWKLFSRNIVRTIYWASDSIAPVCYANAKWEESLGAERSKIKVIYNGVDPHKFRPMLMPENARPTIACIGRVDIFKDIINLIQSVRRVKEKVPDIRCLIYGSSTDLEYSMKCINAVKALKLEDNVQFMGKVKDPEAAYNAADVVVISSITEGFPFAIIEAMACGRGIVATDVGGIREALEGYGVLVRSSHPSELADAIVRLLREKSLRERLGAAAVNKVARTFTIQQSLDMYRQEYERLTNLRSRPRSVFEQEVQAQ